MPLKYIFYSVLNIISSLRYRALDMKLAKKQIYNPSINAVIWIRFWAKTGSRALYLKWREILKNYQMNI